jgi:TolA-binding protein
LKNSMDEIATQNIAMEGYMKQVLDSLQGMQAKIDELQGQLATTTTTVVLGQQRSDDVAARLAALEASTHTAPKQVATAPSSAPPTEDGGTSGAAAARPPASATGSGSMDHRDSTLYRGDARGILGSHRSAPVTGTNSSPAAKFDALVPDHMNGNFERDVGHHNGGRSSTPKNGFPQIRG